MPEPIAHHLGMDVRLQGERRVGVPQAVQGDPRQATPLDQPIERLAEVVRVQRLAARAARPDSSNESDW